MRGAAIAPAILLLAPLTFSPATAAQRSLAVTVDDLPAQRAAALPTERVAEINRRMVATFAAAGVPAVGFVNERKLEVEGRTPAERIRALELWLDAGLELGNHTYSHPDLHKIPVARFQEEILAGERITRRLAADRGVPYRYFRHPYLHTGRDLATRAAVETVLADHGYTVAPVTVDNSEWIFARAYDTARERGDGELGRRIAAAYMEHMEAMVEFYEGQSRALLGREIPQVLLIHANDLNADHLGDLLGLLRRRGYRFTDLADALTDPAYRLPDRYTGPAGISWIQRWAMARGVDPSFFDGEPRVPGWVSEAAGLGAAARPTADAPVPIAGGTFSMGTDAAAVDGLEARYGIDWPGAFDNEVPAHRVTLGDFRLDRHEVTNARYLAFLEENPGWLPDRLPAERHNGDYLRHWRDGSYPEGKGDHPVVNVTWHAAQAFCRWSGGRLPTEAEWEYAARCGDEREFPWGDERPSPELANYHETGHGAAVASGSYPASDCGLQDLAGSVWEFLLDAWEPEYTEAAQTDPCPGCPTTPAEMLRVEGRRAVRGGSFDGSVVNLRTRWRDSHVVTNAIGFVGFRCAYPPESRDEAR